MKTIRKENDLIIVSEICGGPIPGLRSWSFANEAEAQKQLDEYKDAVEKTAEETAALVPAKDQPAPTLTEPTKSWSWLDFIA